MNGSFFAVFIVVVMLVATLVLSAALAYFLIRSGAARAQAPVKVQDQAWVAVQSSARMRALATQAESWNNPDWRTEQIHQARANEATERRVELGRQAVQAPILQVESALPFGPTPPAE